MKKTNESVKAGLKIRAEQDINKKATGNKKMHGLSDKMDSREKEERDSQGDDTIHNRKEDTSNKAGRQ